MTARTTTMLSSLVVFDNIIANTTTVPSMFVDLSHQHFPHDYGDSNNYSLSALESELMSDHQRAAMALAALSTDGSAATNATGFVAEDYHWCSKPRQHFKSLAEVVLILAMGSTCDLLIVVLHLIVLLAFALNASSIFSQPGHYYLLYLVNLSVCDLAIGLVSVPSRLLMDLRGCWPIGNFLCTVYQIVTWLALNGRALTYCAIAYDRYLMIAQGVSYSIKCTRKRILWRIAFLWLFTICIYVPPHFYDVISGDSSTRWPGQCVPEFTVDIYIFNTLIIFSNFFSPILLALLYVLVWSALRARAQAAQSLKKHIAPSSAAAAPPPTTPSTAISQASSHLTTASAVPHQQNGYNNNNMYAVQITPTTTAASTTATTRSTSGNNIHNWNQTKSISIDSTYGDNDNNAVGGAANSLSIKQPQSRRRKGSPAAVHVPLLPVHMTSPHHSKQNQHQQQLQQLSIAEISSNTTTSAANAGSVAPSTATTHTAPPPTSASSISLLHVGAPSSTTTVSTVAPAPTARDRRATRRARRATRSMMLLTSTFLVCQLPFGLTTLTLIMCPNDCCKTSGHFIWRMLVITQYLLFCNSLLNPILYGVAFPAVRAAIESLLPAALVTCLRYMSHCLMQILCCGYWWRRNKSLHSNNNGTISSSPPTSGRRGRGGSGGGGGGASNVERGGSTRSHSIQRRGTVDGDEAITTLMP